jgi:hypothetical protein
MSKIKFVDPPPRHKSAAVQLLSDLSEHPGRWALVAESVPFERVQLWREARRRVGAQGEFTIRQSSKGCGPGFINVFARYDDEAVSS